MSSSSGRTSVLIFMIASLFALAGLAVTPSAVSATIPISVTVSYSVSGGGSGYGAPLFSYMQNGVPNTIQLSLSPIAITIDQGSYWSLSAQLPGSSGAVGWGTRTSSGVATQTMPANFVYYYQALVTLGYSVVGGGRPIVRANYTQFGIVLTNKPVGSSVWLDVGSGYALAQTVGSTVAGERWISAGQAVGTVSGPTVVNVAYYHQYLITAEYGTWGGSPPGIPSISGTAEGLPLSASLTNSYSLLWLDAQTQYQATPAIYANPGERWAARGTTGTVTAPLALTLNYYHQYSLTANYNLVGGASPGQPLIQYSAGGILVSEPLSLSPARFWIDAGAAYGVPLYLPGTSSAERWVLVGPQWSDPVNSPATISPTYYHQYAFQVSYSVVGNGAFSTPTVSYTSFGATQNTTMGQSTLWLDSGTGVAVTQFERGTSPGTMWSLATQVPSTAQGPFSANAMYYLQVQVQVSFLIQDGGSPGPAFSYNSLGRTIQANLAPGGSYWVDNNSTLLAQSIIQGTVGERWILQGGGTGIVTGPLNLSLSYQHQYLVNVSIGKYGGGNVVNSSGWFNPGHQVQLSATPLAGWEFGEWVGSENSTSDVTEVPLNAPIVETAVFYPGITVDAGSGGQVRIVSVPGSGTASLNSQYSTYVYPGTEVTVYAMSSRIYQFAFWSGSVTGNQNPLTLLVTGPTVVKADFNVSVASFALLTALVAMIAVAGYFGLRFLRQRGIRLPRYAFEGRRLRREQS